MPHLETVAATEPYRGGCEDRVAVYASDKRTVIVVADGAGGSGSGDIAAETILREVEAELHRIHSADQWADALRQIDCRISAGEATAVVVDARPYGVGGASVGDSEAWIVEDGKLIENTGSGDHAYRGKKKRTSSNSPCRRYLLEGTQVGRQGFIPGGALAVGNVLPAHAMLRPQ